MSDGMGREFTYLSSHATNRYFIPNWGSFITSDNPVCIMNPFFEICGSRNKLTLENKGICIFMPFSPHHAIMFYDSDVYKIGNRKSWNIYINKEDVSLLNRIIINNANEILIFKDLKYFNTEIIRKVSDKNHSLTTDKKGIKFSFMRFPKVCRSGLTAHPHRCCTLQS